MAELELGPCPICGKPAKPGTRPFCSSRCVDVDLQRWLSGRYVIATEEDGENADESAGDAGQREGRDI